MSSYWHTMTNVSLPLVFTCMIGVYLSKKRGVEAKGLADLCIYALSPCVIIVALAESTSPLSTLSSISAFTIIHTILCWTLATVSSRVGSFSQETKSSLTLTTLIGNSNNYGLPILLLAYGNEGFSLGVAYVIGQIILVNTLGLYVASRSKVNPRQAFKQVLKTPLIYACVIGILLFILHLPLPTGLSSSLKLVGSAYPAIALLILGIQFAKFQFSGLKRKEILLAILLRVLIVPLLSELTIFILGIKGLLASILLVESSMPAGVNAILLSEKFDGDRELVALTVSITTALSFITIPLFISLTHT